MSAETYAALDAAVAAHMADEMDGAYATAWFLTSAGAPSSGDPDSSVYLYANSDGPPHIWLGLLDMAAYRLHNPTRGSDDDD